MQNLGKIVPVMSNLVFMANSPTRQGLFSRRRYIYLRRWRIGSCHVAVNHYFQEHDRIVSACSAVKGQKIRLEVGSPVVIKSARFCTKIFFKKLPCAFQIFYIKCNVFNFHNASFVVVSGLFACQNSLAKFPDFFRAWCNIFLVFNFAKSEFSACFDFKMSVEMLYAADYFFAFRHWRTGSERDCVAFFSAWDFRVRFVGVAPGSASVNKNLELSRNVRPIRRRNGNNLVRPFVFRHQLFCVVRNWALRGLMAFPAAPAQFYLVVVDADRADFIAFSAKLRNQPHDLCSRSVFLPGCSLLQEFSF